MKPLACQNFIESIDFYLHRDLDEDTQQAFEAHQDLCPECNSQLQQAHVMQSVFSMYCKTPVVDYKHDKDALLKQILAQGKSEEEAHHLLHKIQQYMQEIIQVLKKRWLLLPLPIAAACFIFFSTVAFKSPIIDFAVSSHEQPWPSEIETGQLNQVKAWFSKHSNDKEHLEIPRFDRLPHAHVKLEMARLSLIMSAPNQWNKAAHLLYSFAPNKKITVLAFHGKDSPIKGDTVHMINQVPIQFTHATDLTVAHYQRSGISYVITSNLHDTELLKLIKVDLNPHTK
jgi:hypothetical protein